MNIVEYTTSDYGALEVLKSLAWPVADREHYGETQPKFFKEEITFIAKEGDRVIGYITVVVDSGVAQIEPLMVAVDKKGQGIGSALLQAAELKAKDLGCHKVWLETGDTWKAKDFYLKNGFSIRTVLPNHVANQDFILMDKMM